MDQFWDRSGTVFGLEWGGFSWTLCEFEWGGF